MKKNTGILHLSDIHACLEDQQTIVRLVNQLKDDLSKLTDENSITISAICITGDLIKSGDQANQELEIIRNSLIAPLLDYLDLTAESVYIVPGNHEVRRSDIRAYSEQGLESYLTSEKNIREFFSSLDPNAITRISYFNEFMNLWGGKPVHDNGLNRAYLQRHGDFTIGFACINSAWRSTGIGGAEKGKMIVGSTQIIDCFEAIKSADIKVCLLHHPLDWLVDCDKNAVEKCIHQFDIVLNGHIHESAAKVYTTFNGHSLFNTCGKFDNSSDIYNGYSVLSINPFNKDCSIYLRQYIGFPRNCYEAAVSLCPGGRFFANLAEKNDTLALAYNIVHSIRDGFIEYANKYFVSNLASGTSGHNFEDVFIPPLFSEYSDYEKETAIEKNNDKKTGASEQVGLDVICNSKDNLVLLGRKESGKTTAIHYLVKFFSSNFNALKTVPLIIDCTHIDFAGKNVIPRAAMRFVNEFCLSDDSFSLTDIERLLKTGLCTVMFDGFEVVTAHQLEKIDAFLQEYSTNRFIFCEKEVISVSAVADIPVKPACAYKKYHLCSLTKRQIRNYTEKNVIAACQDDKDMLVDKIILCFKNTSLPRTPFILSMILSQCNNADYSPINEAVILEQFMELLLGKHSPAESVMRTYDFRAKEDFLIFLVSEMHSNNRYYFTYGEFSDFVAAYHQSKGFDIVESKFDQVFFQSGVLVRFDQIVRFRFNCMIEYYLAKKASQEADFLNMIMSNQNYVHYANELLYYTGLNRKNANILATLRNDLSNYFDQFRPNLDALNNYQIGIDVSIPVEDFSSRLGETKLTRDESDQLSDISPSPDLPESPRAIDKTASFDEGQIFIQSFLILGSCLKNLEFIDRDIKEDAFRDYLLGLSIILAMMKVRTECDYEKEKQQMESEPAQYSQEDIAELKSFVQDIIRITLPLSIQNVALENVGTIKLKAIYEAAMESFDPHDFKKFFSTFILCDLRVPGAMEIIRNYVGKISDKSLLKVVFFKLMYYYQFRYFSETTDKQLEGVLADINLKMHSMGKVYKSYVIQELKAKRLPEKDIK